MGAFKKGLPLLRAGGGGICGQTLPREQARTPYVSCIGGRFLATCVTWEAHVKSSRLRG